MTICTRDYNSKSKIGAFEYVLGQRAKAIKEIWTMALYGGESGLCRAPNECELKALEVGASYFLTFIDLVYKTETETSEGITLTGIDPETMVSAPPLLKSKLKTYLGHLERISNDHKIRVPSDKITSIRGRFNLGSD